MRERRRRLPLPLPLAGRGIGIAGAPGLLYQHLHRRRNLCRDVRVRSRDLVLHLQCRHQAYPISICTRSTVFTFINRRAKFASAR
jgi:hypothetical protein